jgi:hypothetical protein
MEGDEKFILIKDTFSKLAWVGEGDSSEIWDDNHILLDTVKPNFIKFKSIMGDDPDIDGDDTWLTYSEFLSEFEELSVCQTDFKQSCKLLIILL